MRLDAVGDPEIATRINSFEMAFRMQIQRPGADGPLAASRKHILDMYGAEPGKPSFANNCLLARRLVERGVRFVQIFHEAWDQHGNLVNDLKKNCEDTDQACAALVKDLKQRGLLDDTLVIWGGEFGRTPMVQGGNDGRDHHPNAFTMWLAGGGIKPGITLGESDDLGFNAVKDKVHVHDLHATILHLLGFDHTKLTYRFQGRDFRLTDVHGQGGEEAAGVASPTGISCWADEAPSEPGYGPPLRKPDPGLGRSLALPEGLGSVRPGSARRPWPAGRPATAPSRPSRSCRPRC